MTRSLKLYFILGDEPAVLDNFEVYADITAIVFQIVGCKPELVDWTHHGKIDVSDTTDGTRKSLSFREFEDLFGPYLTGEFLDLIETNAIERALKAADSAWEIEEYA